MYDTVARSGVLVRAKVAVPVVIAVPVIVRVLVAVERPTGVDVRVARVGCGAIALRFASSMI